MGTMLFHLPPGLPDDVLAELERASVAGGQEGMPYPSQAIIDDHQLIVHRRVEESGALHTPWQVNGVGRLMLSTATLMERLTPYYLPIELARGTINNLRSQTADWVMGGLLLTESLSQKIRDATLRFGKAVAQLPALEALTEADTAISFGMAAAEKLVEAYIEQVYQVRHLRQSRLETWLACGLAASPSDELAGDFQRAFNAAQLQFSWGRIEATEGQRDWHEADALVEWCDRQNLSLIGGPLIDFTGRNLPDWLWEKDRDLLSLSGYLTDFTA
ncbi:MAG: hypothetical protein NZO58_05000, partial [Gemmataceae bacterium]|nr:hypothetical protein [Gemmataceae bacterium]